MQPQQLQLEGMPAVLLQFAGLGTLVHAAQVRIGDDGTVRVEVLVQQSMEHHPRVFPLFGAFIYPDQGCLDETISAARRKAMRMPAGTEIVLAGRGIELSRHEGAYVFHVLHVDGLDLPPQSTH
jgi:hypothetical protein